MTDEEKTPSELLAQYDARGVDERTLCQIFQCTEADLANARLEDDYRAELAAQQTEAETIAANTDDNWDMAEYEATRGLCELAGSTADPRLLAQIASTANRAVRKRNTGASAAKAAAPAIQVNTAGDTAVVVIRTAFLERLQSNGNEKALIERQKAAQAEITQDVTETMSSQQATKLIENSLHVDLSKKSARNRMGHDTIDMSELSMQFEDVDDLGAILDNVASHND